MGEIIEFRSDPLLPGLSETLGAELLDTTGDHTPGTRSGKIIEKNAARVQSIIAARAMGISLRQVCELYAVSPHTVAALEERHRTKLATFKDRLARKFGVFVELGLDRAIREVDKMDRDKLLVNIGIAADKLQVLTGEASVIVGVPETKKLTLESLNQRLNNAGYIDVTGSAVPEVSSTREASAEPALPAPGQPASAPASDSSSDNTHCK